MLVKLQFPLLRDTVAPQFQLVDERGTQIELQPLRCHIYLRGGNVTSMGLHQIIACGSS